MSPITSEKLVKYTIKSIAKKYELDYEELKVVFKKVIKTAKNFDQSLLGMMEEMMDLGNVGSPEELDDFNIEVLKMYCKIKELDISGSERHIRSRVWKNIESEFELDEDDDEDDDDEDDDDDEEDDEDEEEEIEEVEVEKKKKKSSIKKESS
jgi:hypothetical protein